MKIKNQNISQVIYIAIILFFVFQANNLKAFEINGEGKIIIERFEMIIEEMKDYSQIYLGLLSGSINNENEIKEVATKQNLEILKPGEVIGKILL